MEGIEPPANYLRNSFGTIFRNYQELSEALSSLMYSSIEAFLDLFALISFFICFYPYWVREGYVEFIAQHSKHQV